MPMSSSQDASMFPTYDFNYSSFQEECWKEFKVVPRPQWITTQFGGHVREPFFEEKLSIFVNICLFLITIVRVDGYLSV